MLEKLHIFISVIVALIVTIVGIAMNMTLAEIGLRLIITISVFYILGLSVKTYLSKRVFAPKPGGKSLEDRADELSWDEHPVDKLLADELSLDQHPLDELPLGELPPVQLPADQQPLGEQHLVQLPADEQPVNY